MAANGAMTARARDARSRLTCSARARLHVSDRLLARLQCERWMMERTQQGAADEFRRSHADDFPQTAGTPRPSTVRKRSGTTKRAAKRRAPDTRGKVTKSPGERDVRTGPATRRVFSSKTAKAQRQAGTALTARTSRAAWNEHARKLPSERYGKECGIRRRCAWSARVSAPLILIATDTHDVKVPPSPPGDAPWRARVHPVRAPPGSERVDRPATEGPLGRRFTQTLSRTQATTRVTNTDTHIHTCALHRDRASHPHAAQRRARTGRKSPRENC